MAILIGFFLGHCNSIWIPTVLIAIRKWDAEPEVLIPTVISPVKHMSRTRKNKIYLMEVKRICLLLFICFPPKMETMFSPFAFKLSYNHNTSVSVPLLSVSKPCHLPSCPCLRWLASLPHCRTWAHTQLPATSRRSLSSGEGEGPC